MSHEGATWAEMTRNLLYTVPGNIVGGGLLVGAVYGWAGRESGTPPSVLPAAIADAVVTAVPTADLPETVPVPAMAAVAVEPDPESVTSVSPAAAPKRASARRRVTTPPPSGTAANAR